ncbi:hypothetical protein ASG22_09750 [Chryseobacterium sp. Leaf405]|uniref:hypothetical protein n=1 Tax=Chryseobacterium sp. Leaf405 TaxID=1736367 RepID=UPI0006FA4430|nr:hypothetical protein [Chryseobacterium sp. Leaf405]KQT24286.1 hypothetical protein ASG22_09750 [Chryseobacterium sp. Leaf405]
MPSENINFQDIWNKKSAEIPNITEIKSKAEKYRTKKLFSIIFQMGCLILSSAFIIYLWNIIDFKLFTTRLGFIFVLAAIGMYIYLYSQNINIIRKINPAISNQEYLTALKKLQKQQLYMQTKGISIYFILLSLGFAVYFYEFVLRMSLFGGILSYGLTFFWMAINWFFIRPRQIRKQNAKISAVIDSLEMIEKSFEE